MPTIKQKKAFKESLENGGNVTEAMKTAEYAEATIHNPQNLTESDGWKALMHKYLPDDKLAKRHEELLDKREKVIIEHKDRSGNSDIYEVLDQPDTQAVSKGLEMAYKLKGAYAPEKSVQVQVKTDTKDMTKLLEIKEKYEKEMFEAIKAEIKDE